jgi:transposase-like protein
MAAPTSPELRSQIIASIKAGMPIASAAETHHIAVTTISKWMRDLSKSSHSATNELQKAKKQIAFLEHVVLSLTLEQKAQTYKG